MPWQACHGAVGPGGPGAERLPPDPGFRRSPGPGAVDPLHDRRAPSDTRPRALYVAGVASSEAWLNGQRLGANGRPGATARAEVPGRYQAIFPIRETAWRPGENTWCCTCRPSTAACVSPAR
jgi:hypothetical protein